MPSPYELKTRWLEWHERWPVPEIESLKRQIDCIKREIAGYQKVRAVTTTKDALKKCDDLIGTLREVLATLEQLGPHEPGDVIPPAPQAG